MFDSPCLQPIRQYGPGDVRSKVKLANPILSVATTSLCWPGFRVFAYNSSRGLNFFLIGLLICLIPPFIRTLSVLLCQFHSDAPEL